MRAAQARCGGAEADPECVAARQGFKGYAKKGKAEQHVLEKIVTRPIHPLNDTKEVVFSWDSLS
eukprot:2449183-Rhodomonas_salina.5